MVFYDHNMWVFYDFMLFYIDRKNTYRYIFQKFFAIKKECLWHGEFLWLRKPLWRCS